MPKVADVKKAGAAKEQAPEVAAGPKKQRLETVGLEEIDETLNGLWYGEGGTTKTTSVATMANEGPVLFINSEAGLKRRPLLERDINIENIRIFPPPGEELTFENLEEMYWQMKEDLEENPESWAGTCWDSITEIHKKLLEQVVINAQRKAENRGQPRERFFIDRADYGIMTEQIRLLLRRFRDLPCHFAVTALERRDQDDDGKVQYGPAVTPALQSDLIGYVDVVIHTTMEPDGPWGLTRPVGKYRAKDRIGALPINLPEPTFARVLAYINDEITEDTDELLAAANERREEEAKATVEQATA